MESGPNTYSVLKIGTGGQKNITHSYPQLQKHVCGVQSSTSVCLSTKTSGRKSQNPNMIFLNQRSLKTHHDSLLQADKIIWVLQAKTGKGCRVSRQDDSLPVRLSYSPSVSLSLCFLTHPITHARKTLNHHSGTVPLTIQCPSVFLLALNLSLNLVFYWKASLRTLLLFKGPTLRELHFSPVDVSYQRQ